MNNDDPVLRQDVYLASVINSKKSRSVIKTEFAQSVSAIPADVKVFCVEGPGDRVVYYHWVKKICPQLSYEFYQCGNKDKVLQLFDALEIDRTGVGNRVYFFVDRDFDDLQGRLGNERVFMTDKYAVENYLVTSEVLNDILALEFHCNGAPAVRSAIIGLFERVYEEHLAATRELNFRAYVAKLLGFPRVRPYPERIGQISNVELSAVGQLEVDLAQVIIWQRDLTEEEERKFRESFDALVPKDRYRGKFALCFFTRWLELLRVARQSANCELFTPLPLPENKINGNFSLETIAPKAAPPEKLYQFFAAI